MRKNKDATVIPPLSSNTPLDDTTIPLDDYFETNHEVHVPSPLTSETATLNLMNKVGDILFVIVKNLIG